MPKSKYAINEENLTKGQLRKLNVLRKTLGEEIAEEAFSKRYEQQEMGGGEAEDDPDIVINVDAMSKELNVSYTHHAVLRMKDRGLTSADVLKVLTTPLVHTVDIKTGHIISRLGNLRIVSKINNTLSLTVITAMNDDDFEMKAG